MLSAEEITLSVEDGERINKMFTREEAREVESNTIALAAGIKLKHERRWHCKVDRRDREEVTRREMARKMTHVCDIDVFCCRRPGAPVENR